MEAHRSNHVGFVATHTQRRFILDRTPIRLLCGGLGSGKTTTGARAFLYALQMNPLCDAMMVAPTLPMFRRFQRPAWEAACPPGLIRSHHRTDRLYVLSGGQRVWYGSAEEPSSLEGTNLGAYWGDEVRYWPEESFRNLNARLRDVRAERPQGILTSTPAPGWMQEQFDRGLDGRVVHRISTRENERNLAPGYLQQLRQTYTQRLCASLIDGEFTVIEGQVYEAFETERHVIDWTVDRSLRTVLWMDFGVRRSSVLLAQETGDWEYFLPGRAGLPPHSLVVFDELHPEGLSTEKTIPLIQRMLAKHGIRELDAIDCDPAGSSRDIASGMPSVELLQAAFGPIVRFQRDARWTWIPNGVQLVQGALDPAVGAPLLYVHRRLAEQTGRTHESNNTRGLVKSLRGYRYPDEGGEHPLKDDLYDHAMDALRYGVMGSCQALGRDIARAPVHVVTGARR